MKTLTATALIATLLGASSALALQPIPGSITYNGHQSRLEKAPAGSNFFHTFFGQNGEQVRETYQVNADHSVSLVSRAVANDK
ncbi:MULTISPECIES: hypothetical protein [Alphaproteobacteria]|uniref:Transmembrane protein n=2 Tax=Alphaproteobacteria TaxID=28211 RepID=A0A512HMU2_9HYPH|nr:MULTISPECIES: hypothetical protein [Alphaproteobacteria]GEO86763.1 hypothetical protein RNA01_36950 [Ciceribacter naphthalenivorans]GLR23342.1 hypothetical protein GCM10007920_31330 [Ciceribacter naphthalenivorans]GLT06198.1 hypothetical protein GCM10007926_31330 [Sphingomonas psychrolutea]